MKIVTTPMCEKILKFAGISDYKVNKNPDEENGDLAILLSESKTKMNNLSIKLNTFSQIKDSIIEVSKLNKNLNKKNFASNDDLIIQNIKKIFSEYSIANEWIQEDKKKEFQNKNSHIKIKVYSQFIRDIVEDMGFIIVESDNDNFNNYFNNFNNNSNSNNNNNNSDNFDVNEYFDYIVFPDYMKDFIDVDINNLKNKMDENIFISIPTHSNVSKDPIKRAEMRYSILNDLKK